MNYSYAYRPTTILILSNRTSYFFYRGKFGTVCKAKEKSTGNIYAAKYIKITPASRKEVTEEINMMNKIHHKRLVYLYDAYETAKDLIMVMEL